MGKLNFQIEIKRVLEILSNDIYDSPYALLRENIQNGYDAILMRIAENNSFEPKIEVTISNNRVTILDNGIGMNEDVLQNNFWKAGSSGKNNDLAKKAGVVGTFGIGAMANFGVSDYLKVTSRRYNEDNIIETFANRDELSVTEECINFNMRNDDSFEYGTLIEVNIDNNINLNKDNAIEYLKPYIQYVQIPIYINGELISQRKVNSILEISDSLIEKSETIYIKDNSLSCTLNYTLTKKAEVQLQVTDIIYNKNNIIGQIVLKQGENEIFGLRNYFGLAHMPLSNSFSFGGVINLSNLHPTAGREALSRESLNFASTILNIIQKYLCESISKIKLIDNNTNFLNYIVTNSRYDLANNIKIDMKPGENNKILLSDVAQEINGKNVLYYGGRNQDTINTFGNENTNLLHLSQVNPRRTIQYHILLQKQIQQASDHPRIEKILEVSEFSLEEAAITIRMSSILSDDYLLADNQVLIANISHNVPHIVKKEQDTLYVYIDNRSQQIQQLINTYKTAYEVLNGFIKDFIRNYLYQKIAPYIPSSTRGGADALHKILAKNKELFEYEKEDLGELDGLLNDYINGDIKLSDVLKQSKTIHRSHTQSVSTNQVGNAELEIPALVDETQSEIVNDNSQTIQELTILPLPPIFRTDSKTDKKILKTQVKYKSLNNFDIFLSLSNSVYKRQLDFFFEPHSTKVIWGMHRIVYIFTHVSNKISLYYDIELKEKISGVEAGGKAIPTTTILTKDKIFIPIVPELENYFDIQEGKKEFFVRHDLIFDKS